MAFGDSMDDAVDANLYLPFMRRAWSWKASGVRRAFKGRVGAIDAALVGMRDISKMEDLQQMIASVRTFLSDSVAD